MDGRDPAHLVGTVVADRYRVQALVGTGSMSAVYEVEDQQAGARAAMKVLLPGLGDDPVIAARFVREAKAMCLFEHRNIVDLRDLGRLADGAPFIVTDLVQGVSLRQLVADGVIGQRRALSIARQVLEALAHAHAVGVVHRDIEPENIMLVDGGAPDGETDLVKVLDFGVAKLVGDSKSLLGESTLTQAGSRALGSPLYSAPESLLGQAVDVRADLYSVGVVLFELLTGKPPFADDDPVALTRLHVTAPVPTLAQGAPERVFTQQLEYVVGEALAKKPEHRFARAPEMLAALDAADRSLDPILGGGTIRSLVPPPSVLAAAQRPPAEPQRAATDPPRAEPPRSVPAPPATPVKARLARLVARARAGELRRFWWLLAGIGLLIVIAAIAAIAGRGGDGKGDPASAAGAATPANGSAGAPARAETGADLLERGHAALERGRRLDALAAYERAIRRSPELAADVALRAKVAGILESRDAVAAVIALEVLATRLRPAAHDEIAAQASSGKLAEVRRRAFAIAERDGFADRVDRTESWSLDLKQVATCDERKAVIANLRSTGDRRAIAALRQARAQHACVVRDATAAIAHLEAGPGP